MSRQSLPDKVRTERTGWRVVGFADRFTLPKKIVDFCGSFPILNVEPIPLDAFNTTMVRDFGKSKLSAILNFPSGTGNLSRSGRYRLVILTLICEA